MTEAAIPRPYGDGLDDQAWQTIRFCKGLLADPRLQGRAKVFVRSVMFCTFDSGATSLRRAQGLAKVERHLKATAR
jgi:hypothetical protein